MKLSDKIKFALDEGRMLILGGQVLLSFGYQSIFQPGFAKLPILSQDLLLVSIPLMLIGLMLTMSPAACDCLVERGEPTERFLRFATWMIGCGLMPFALGLGIAAGVAVRIVAGPTPGLLTGIFTALLAIAFWYGGRIVDAPASQPLEKGETVELKDKINHALTEARMVLPGVQAMLGFQFIAMLAESFERLPVSSKIVHVISLGMTSLTIIFLITPAAFHRIVERGEATERQHRMTTAFLLAAMVTLPPAITGDLFVVLMKVKLSLAIAAAVSAGMLSLFYLTWFGWGLTIRHRDKAASG